MIYCVYFYTVRYLARKFGFYGSNELEMAQCDMYSDALVDYSFNFVQWLWCPFPDLRIQLKTKLVGEQFPAIMKIFEERLTNSKSGFIIGDKLTFVDVCLFCMVDGSDKNYFDHKTIIFETYPHVKEHFEKIGNIPRIAEWLEKRPNYPY